MAFGMWRELGQIVKFRQSPQTNTPWTRSPPSPVRHAHSVMKSNRNSVKPPTGKQRTRRCTPRRCATHSTARGFPPYINLFTSPMPYVLAQSAPSGPPASMPTQTVHMDGPWLPSAHHHHHHHRSPSQIQLAQPHNLTSFPSLEFKPSPSRLGSSMSKARFCRLSIGSLWIVGVCLRSDPR